MPTLITRSSKGSELSHAELDANFKRTISQKTATYTALISDNRSVIECVHATVAFTVTLGDAATMATGGTGDYEITIINIGAAVVTVARAGADTIDGAATSITLNQYESVTLKSVSAGDGYMSVARGLGGLTSAVDELNILDGVTSTAAELNILDGVTSTATELNLMDGATLRHKVIDIGDWNMDADITKNVSHGLGTDYTKVRSVSAYILNDAGSAVDFGVYAPGGSSYQSIIVAGTSSVSLSRATNGYFDNTSYDATSYNRGYITIWYID